jgi:hypothetical protein
MPKEATAIMINKTMFSFRYRLKKDTLRHTAGCEYGWCWDNRRFYPIKNRSNKPKSYLDYFAMGITLSEIKNEKWFEPIGQKIQLLPDFPSTDKLEELNEYVDVFPEFYGYGEDCDCNNEDKAILMALDKLLSDRNFQNRLYEFYREQYALFYGRFYCPEDKKEAADER